MMLKGLLITEDGNWNYGEYIDDLENFHALIDCETVDMKFWWIGGHRFAFVLDDEGRLKSREPTVFGPNADPVFVGSVLVFGVRRTDDGLDFASLTDSEIDMLETCSAVYAVGAHRKVLTNVTMREFTPWTLEVGD